MTTEAQEINPNTSCTVDIEVTRNDTPITFTPTNFAKGAKAKLGIKYPYTGDINEETLSIFRKWLGDENFFGLLNEGWRLWIQSLYNSVLENDPQKAFNATTFKEFASDLTVTSDTLEDLRNKSLALQEKLNVVAGKASSGTGDVASYLREFISLTEEMKAINTKMMNKKRTKKVKPEPEEEDNVTVQS